MSIASEISRLQTAKAGLKTAIEAKGVTVPSATTLDGYPALVSAIPSGGGGKWVRPDDYPNLDEISLNNFEGVYLTYDLRLLPEHPYIAIYANVGNAQTTSYSVQRGHLENGAFVVDETHSVASLSAYRDTLDDQNGDVQLWRVIPNDNNSFLNLHFTTDVGSGKAYYGGAQPVAERRGRLPNVNAYSSALTLGTTSTAYAYNSTFWLKKDYIILPSTKAINMKNAYRDSLQLQEVTILGDNNGTISLNAADGMFMNCYVLPEVDMSAFRLESDATNINSMFNNAYAIQEIDLSYMLIANNVYNMGSIFSGCKGCKKIKFGKKVKTNSASYLFNACLNLEEFDIENLGIDNANTAYCAFSTCQKLKELDISHWYDQNTEFTDTRTIFQDMASLVKLKLPAQWPVSSTAANAIGVPVNCYNLRDFNGIVIYQNHNYSSDWALTHDSIVNILNALPTIDTNKTITLGDNKNKITDAEIAIATAKGWTVA